MSPRLLHWLTFCLFEILGCWVMPTLRAQPVRKPMRVITTKDGLPQSFVSGLVQDDDGFVWVGTRNGLARYDGSRFKVFHHRNQDTTTLTSNVIIALRKDTHNQIWIEHESGDIDVMNPETEIISRVTARALFRSQPGPMARRGWLPDTKGNLWGIKRSHGLVVYNWNQQTVSHYTHRSHGLPSDTIRGLLEDRKRQIWVVSQRSISRFDPHTERFRHIPIPFPLDFNTYLDSDAEIIAVHERKNGEIMLGDRKQLIFFQPDRRTFRTVPLEFYPGQGIRRIQTGPDGNEYLESEGRVYRYSDEAGLKLVGETRLTAFRDAQSLLIDRSGLIWLGTNAAGIHQIDLKAPSFESNAYTTAFHQDVLQQRFGIALNQLVNWPLTDHQFIFSSYFFRSAYDANRHLWIALRDRVFQYDATRNRWISLPPVPQIQSSTNLTLGIRGLHFAPNGTLWTVAHNGRIASFDRAGQKWTELIPASKAQQWVGQTTPVDLLADQTSLWLTTASEGLWAVDLPTRQFRHIRQQTHPAALPTNLLLGLVPDPTRPDLLWIGSYEGLICLNKKTLKSQFFSTEEGLPDNTIYSIVPDKAGYLWLSTNKGLCRFHPVTHQIRKFQTADGLPGDEFNRFHHLQLPDGRLAFGGTDGWTLFDPTTVKDDNYQPPVAFTNLSINNTPVSYGSTVLLTAPLNRLTELVLPFDQNSLTFELAGLEFNQPQKLLYRYQLEGYDDNWIQAGHSSVINYTKLPPGQYVLKINATNMTGQWSRQIRTLPVIIKPPFWQTWWAYGFYGLLLSGLIRAYIHYRLNRERLRQEVVLKEKEAEHLKANAEWQTRFFTNITHEFRTPLTLIINPLERLLEQPALPQKNQLRQQHVVIHRNARRLLRLINQLLDVSKLEAGQLTLVESRGNVATFFRELVDSFRPTIEKKGLHFEYDSTGFTADYLFDAEKFEIIGYNLLSNALKFTPQGGSVRVAWMEETAGEKPQLRLRVADTGIGIPAKQLPHIFDRFFQGHESPTSLGGGTGIGLFLVNELTKLLGGQVAVESQPGQGTTFTVTLPLHEAPHPSETVKSFSLHPSKSYMDSVPELPVVANANAPVMLVVEDNDELRHFIAQELSGTYRILTAVDGQEGWETVLRELPDLVISDIMMPLVDGYTLVQRIKNTPLTAHIAVILLTARTLSDSRIKGLSAGANDYLTKPFHLPELQLRIANLLRHQQQLRQYWQQQVKQPDPVGFPASPDGPSTEDPFLLELYQVLDQELSNSAFTVEPLAEALAVSPRTLHRKITALTGMNTGELIRSYRLRKAARLLEEGSSVSEAAEKVGFEGLSYFSKQFKAQFAVSPSTYLLSRNRN